LIHPSGRSTLAIHVLGSRSYQDLDVDADGGAAWLNSDRDILFGRRGKLLSLDIATRRAREVAVPVGTSGGRATDWIGGFALPADARALFVVRARANGEIWQMTLPQR
jgi:hypothetical protein